MTPAGAGHHGYGQEFDAVPFDEGPDPCGGIRLKVAVDDDVVFSALKNSSQREHRQRKSPVVCLRNTRIEEDDHYNLPAEELEISATGPMPCV